MYTVYVYSTPLSIINRQSNYKLVALHLMQVLRKTSLLKNNATWDLFILVSPLAT